MGAVCCPQDPAYEDLLTWAATTMPLRVLPGMVPGSSSIVGDFQLVKTVRQCRYIENRNGSFSGYDGQQGPSLAEISHEIEILKSSAREIPKSYMKSRGIYKFLSRHYVIAMPQGGVSFLARSSRRQTRTEPSTKLHPARPSQKTSKNQTFLQQAAL
jgi:hypothetical protein